MIWLARAQAVNFQIKSCTLGLRNVSAPFGALVSGHMIVEGLACSTSLAIFCRSGSDGSGVGDIGIRIMLDAGGDSSKPGFLDGLEHQQPEDRITLLEVVTFRPLMSPKGEDMMDHPRGLVLSERNYGSYERVGLYYSPWEETYYHDELRWKNGTFKLI